MTGITITIRGLQGSGKTIAATLIRQALKGKKTKFRIREIQTRVKA